MPYNTLQQLCRTWESGNNLFLIIGPVGSGKSFYYDFMVREGGALPVENVDVNNSGQNSKGTLNPFRQSLKFTQILQESWHAVIERGDSVVLESSMTINDEVAALIRAKSKGLNVIAFSVVTKDPEISARRVAERCMAGGYPVPHEEIVREYDRFMKLLPFILEHIKDAVIVDNSGDIPIKAALFRNGKIKDPSSVPRWLVERVLNTYEEHLKSREKILTAFQQSPKSNETELVEADVRLGARFTGPIIATTKHHALQRTSQSKVVLHYLALIESEDFKEGDVVDICYFY